VLGLESRLWDVCGWPWADTKWAVSLAPQSPSLVGRGIAKEGPGVSSALWCRGLGGWALRVVFGPLVYRIFAPDEILEITLIVPCYERQCIFFSNHRLFSWTYRIYLNRIPCPNTCGSVTCNLALVCSSGEWRWNTFYSGISRAFLIDGGYDLRVRVHPNRTPPWGIQILWNCLSVTVVCLCSFR